jgi:hypothetical protein
MRPVARSRVGNRPPGEDLLRSTKEEIDIQTFERLAKVLALPLLVLVVGAPWFFIKGDEPWFRENGPTGARQ